MDVYILDVGYGNMALIMNPDGSRYVIDCNITNDNRDAILRYTKKVFGAGTPIDAFINTHRDADHMRGIADLHAQHPISRIWDTDVPGTTTDSPEYLAYMRLRRSVECVTIDPRKFVDKGFAKYRYMNGKWDDYTDPNQQSAVVKIEYKTPSCSVLFAADTDYRPWKEKILPFYSDETLKSTILIASHHGSITFFDDPSDGQHYYEAHIKKVVPDVTLISVGPNVHGLPDQKAIELYEKHSNGTTQGDKVFMTQDKGHMKITLMDDGNCFLAFNQ